MPVINFPTMIIMVRCVHGKHRGPAAVHPLKSVRPKTEHRDMEISLNLLSFFSNGGKKMCHGHDIQQHVRVNTAPAASGIPGATWAPRKYSKLALCREREAWHWFPNGGSRLEWNTLGRCSTLSAHVFSELLKKKKTITKKMVFGHVWDDRKTLSACTAVEAALVFSP